MVVALLGPANLKEGERGDRGRREKEGREESWSRKEEGEEIQRRGEK